MNIKKSKTDVEWPYLVSDVVFIRRKKVRLLPGDDGNEIKTKIGGSISNSGVLRAFDAATEAKYLPYIISSDPSKTDWAKETEAYWKNISVDVPDGIGKKLEKGFKFKTEEDAKANVNGFPINVADYVLFRYCQVYSRVANTINDIYKSPKIRFYLHDEKIELTNKLSQAELERKAMGKYLEIYNDSIKVDAVLSVLKVGVGLRLSPEQKVLALSEAFKANTEDFLTVASDEELMTKSLIEKAIIAGHLRVIPNTHTYLMGDNVIANSREELVVKLNDENNKALKTQLEALIKNLPFKRD